MLDVRGIYKPDKLRQHLAGLRLEVVDLLFRFELYDTAAPAVALFGLDERWHYPLEAFDGLTSAQIRTMVVDTGYLAPFVPPPGVPLPPGAVPPPNPPPMAERKVAFTDFVQNARRVLQIDPGEV